MAYIILIISILINIIGLFYVKWLIKNLTFLTEKMTDVWELINLYDSHVNSLHDLEMFYGDENLKKLMEHGRELIEILDEYRNLLLIKEEGIEDTEEEKE